MVVTRVAGAIFVFISSNICMFILAAATPADACPMNAAHSEPGLVFNLFNSHIISAVILPFISDTVGSVNRACARGANCFT